MKRNTVYAASSAALLTMLSGVLLAQSPAPVQRQDGSAIPALSTQQRFILSENARLRLEAAQDLEKGRYHDAETIAKRAFDLFNDGASLDIIAQAQDRSEKTAEAIATYTLIIGHFDIQPMSLLPYARLMLQTGNYAQAAEAYNRAMPFDASGEPVYACYQFDPKVSQPTALQVAIHVAQGVTYDDHCDWAGQPQHALAKNEYLEALKLDPDSAVATYYLGYNLFLTGHGDDARAAYEKAAALSTDGIVKRFAAQDLWNEFREKMN